MGFVGDGRCLCKSGDMLERQAAHWEQALALNSLAFRWVASGDEALKASRHGQGRRQEGQQPAPPNMYIFLP